MLLGSPARAKVSLKYSLWNTLKSQRSQWVWDLAVYGNPSRDNGSHQYSINVHRKFSIFHHSTAVTTLNVGDL